MFDKIRIQNFKCFEDSTIELAKLNVLTGENSAGKSSIIQAVLLLLQNHDSVHRNRRNALNGHYVNLGQYSDVKNMYTRGDLCVQGFLSKGDKIEDIRITEDGSVARFMDGKDAEVIYLVADRIGVRNEYERNEQGIDKIGIQGEYAFDYLSEFKMENIEEEDFIKDSSSGKNLGNQVDYWLEYLTGYSVKAEKIEGTSIVKVSYQTPKSIKELRPRHVGTGVSYLATVIIAALSCTKESILIVENPEIHLHPKAQSRFVELFTFLASKGLQIIIETHSDHIINGIRKEIKKDKIALDDTNIYFIKKDARDIAVPVKMQLNKSGTITNQEKGFFDQFDDDLDILLGLDLYE